MVDQDILEVVDSLTYESQDGDEGKYQHLQLLEAASVLVRGVGCPGAALTADSHVGHGAVLRNSRVLVPVFHPQDLAQTKRTIITKSTIKVLK